LFQSSYKFFEKLIQLNIFVNTLQTTLKEKKIAN